VEWEKMKKIKKRIEGVRKYAEGLLGEIDE
jgi:hypothetical protein